MKKLMICAALIASAITVHAAPGNKATDNHVLRYNRPAAMWTEALPIGNGRLTFQGNQ